MTDMIRAMLFDLDGTLVQTESLKAISYARAAVELCPRHITEEAVIDAFKEVVGLSRQEVSQRLIEKFNLQDVLMEKMKNGQIPATSTLWQAFAQVRLKKYEELLSDPQILHDHLCPFNVGLLKYARSNNQLKTGLATMSQCEQAQRVLEILDLHNMFDFIATRDDVENGKPDPEIYLLVAHQLEVSPPECIVIEDSATGVKAALAAGMKCIVVTTDFTRESVYNSGLLEDRWIVDDTTKLMEVAKQAIGVGQ